MISFQLEATPICGLGQSASVMPTARNMPRAAALLQSVGNVLAAGLHVDHGVMLVIGPDSIAGHHTQRASRQPSAATASPRHPLGARRRRCRVAAEVRE